MKSEEERELKRQWSMVERQNKRLKLCHCASYEATKRKDILFAIVLCSIGIACIAFVLM